jgi:hypothetical protein
MTPKGIARKYGARARKYLRAVKDGLKGAGLHVQGPDDMGSKDEFAWSLYVAGKPIAQIEDGDDAVDITFRVLESEEWDGTEGGVSFGVDAVTTEGSEIASLTPGNYTDDVWVSIKDASEIDDRFLLVEGVDPGELVYLVAKHFGKGA